MASSIVDLACTNQCNEGRPGRRQCDSLFKALVAAEAHSRKGKKNQRPHCSTKGAHERWITRGLASSSCRSRYAIRKPPPKKSLWN